MVSPEDLSALEMDDPAGPVNFFKTFYHAKFVCMVSSKDLPALKMDDTAGSVCMVGVLIFFTLISLYA